MISVCRCRRDREYAKVVKRVSDFGSTDLSATRLGATEDWVVSASKSNPEIHHVVCSLPRAQPRAKKIVARRATTPERDSGIKLR